MKKQHLHFLKCFSKFLISSSRDKYIINGHICRTEILPKLLRSLHIFGSESRDIFLLLLVYFYYEHFHYKISKFVFLHIIYQPLTKVYMIVYWNHIFSIKSQLKIISFGNINSIIKFLISLLCSRRGIDIIRIIIACY